VSDLKFTTAGDIMDEEDLTWTLSPHGRTLQVAQWIVETYADRVGENEATERWVTASQQILDMEKDDEH